MRGALLTPLVILLLAIASPASADTGHLEVSVDGESWQSRLAQPLFEDLVMVPGDTESETFFVRNASEDDAVLNVLVREAGGGSAYLGRHLRLEVSSGRSGLGSSAPFADVPTCVVASRGVHVPPGSAIPVQVTARFDSTAQSPVMSRASAQFSLIAALTEAAHIPDDVCSPNDGPVDSALPDTGASRHLEVASVLAAGLLTVGVLLLRRRRRGSA